ncbi:hypothetical protein OAP36_02085 [Planktomarina temperata]|nr:hypothetical protein [Planktomarina temperata]
MTYLFVVYIIVNIAISLLVGANCNSYASKIIISHFNDCNWTVAVSAASAFLHVGATYIFLTIIKKTLLPQKTPIRPHGESHGILFLNLLWIILALTHFYVARYSIDYLKIRGILFTMAVYLLPTLIYVRYCQRTYTVPKSPNYIFPTLLASILLSTKSFLLLYLSHRLLGLSKFSVAKKVFYLIFLLLTTGLAFQGLQLLRGYLLYNQLLQLDVSIWKSVLKLTSRFLLVDQVFFAIKLSAFDNIKSIVDLEIASKNYLYRVYGYSPEAFGFSLSLVGQMLAVYGYYSLLISTFLLYLLLGFFAKSARLTAKGFAIFPFGLTILNGGINLQTTLLIVTLILLSLLYRFRIIR